MSKINKVQLHRVILLTVFFSFLLCGACFAAEGYEKVAGDAQDKPVMKYGMIPVRGQDIKDGTYDVEALSSSSFLRLKDVKLTVKDGAMKVRFNIDSLSYSCIYPGTGEEAAKASEKDYIFPETEEGISTFEMPVEGLDQEISCAAFSKRKKQWYDRRILFTAASLPEDALSFSLPDYDLIGKAVEQYDKGNGVTGSTDTEGGQDAVDTKDPVDVDLSDGTYSIEVNMTGGSGRASVSSPTWLMVKNGKAYARLLWSSSHYDYMIVGGEKYLNETTDGSNSTFLIPITTLDRPMRVIADTTAMDEPVEVEYQMTFYRSTMGSKSQIPQEAAKRVLVVAMVIIILGGIVNFLVKKRKRA